MRGAILRLIAGKRYAITARGKGGRFKAAKSDDGFFVRLVCFYALAVTFLAGVILSR